MRQFYGYILASRSRQIYVGVTGDLLRRLLEHRTTSYGFSAQYRTNRLVYFESTRNARAAIEREKQIKGWRRLRKIQLIESINPAWDDLADGWFDTGRADPSLRSG